MYTKPQMSIQKVVILGGGFGGVKAALELYGEPNFDVTLVSDEDSFRYYPALYHTATGGTDRVSSIPMAEIIGELPIHFVKGKATRLDRDKKELEVKGTGRLPYDTLIVALGMTTNYFGIKGLEQFSYGIKSIEEVTRLRDHLHTQLQDEHKPDQHYLVIGGGPTGVELAGMLPSYLSEILRHHQINHRSIHVELIEAAPRILPRSPAAVSKATAKQLRRLGVVVRTNQKVEAETADALVINGKPLKSHTVIWTAGVASNPFLQDNHFTMSDHHRVVVDQYLQAEPNIYVLGDNAETKYGGVAQTALHDAKFVAENLKRLQKGQTAHAYKPSLPIYVTPTGPRWASVVWGGLHFYGRLGWMLREAAHFVAYHDYQPWWPAAKRWAALHETEERCPICGTSQATPVQ